MIGSAREVGHASSRILGRWESELDRSTGLRCLLARSNVGRSRSKRRFVSASAPAILW